jgi:hypothetical protein
MNISDASYGVNLTVYKALMFSKSLSILIENENDILYPTIKTVLQNPNQYEYVELSPYFRINFKSQTIDIRGYKVSEHTYIASKESDIVYSINNPRNSFHTLDLLDRFYHMYITV